MPYSSLALTYHPMVRQEGECMEEKGGKVCLFLLIFQQGDGIRFITKRLPNTIYPNKCWAALRRMSMQAKMDQARKA
jgi:hypothetical protein